MSVETRSSEHRGQLTESAPTRRAEGRARRLHALLLVVRLGPVLVLALLMVLMSILSPFFFTERNLLNVGVQAAPIALLAIGQFVVILTRGIDLSVGAVAALSAVTAALYFQAGARSGLVAVLVMLGVGLGAGLINGLLYVKFRIPHPFIVTLGTLNIASGAAYLLADGEAVVGVPPIVDALGTDEVLGVPCPIVVVLVAVGLAIVLLQRTQIGSWIYAIGGNPDAARRAGIPVDRVLVFCYVLCGGMAALGGLILAGRTATGDPNAGQLMELQAIAAVIIGGASFFGGRGHVATVLIGAAVLAVIANGLNLLDVNAFWQLVATGGVLIVAVVMDVWRGRIEGRLRLAAGEAA